MTATIGPYQEGMHGLYNQGLFDFSTTAKHRLGTRRILDDGREFVYCSNTAAAIAAGTLISKAQGYQACTVAAADALVNITGTKKVTYTLTGTPTADLYKDGWLVVSAGPGLGQMHKIIGNTADDDPAAGRCTFNLFDPIITDQTTATTVSMWQNPYSSLLLNPAVADLDATTQETVMGVTTRIVPASRYFWAQVWGLGSVLLDVAAAAGAEANEMQLVLGVTAGRAGIIADAAIPGMQIIGNTLQSADLTNATANLVMLQIG